MVEYCKKSEALLPSYQGGYDQLANFGVLPSRLLGDATVADDRSSTFRHFEFRGKFEKLGSL
jgi:hypothetical protein